MFMVYMYVFPHSVSPQVSGGRRLPLTGITTAPNAAYFELSVGRVGCATLPPRPSEPLYDSVGDFSVWKDRAKRGVQQLLKSLPRPATPPGGNPPHLPPSHPNRSQSLHRGQVAPPKGEAPPTATPKGEAPPTSTPTAEAPPVAPEDSPMRNRPPAPLPEEARESDEEDDAYVYERVVNDD